MSADFLGSLSIAFRELATDAFQIEFFAPRLGGTVGDALTSSRVRKDWQQEDVFVALAAKSPAKALRGSDDGGEELEENGEQQAREPNCGAFERLLQRVPLGAASSKAVVSICLLAPAGMLVLVGSGPATLVATTLHAPIAFAGLSVQMKSFYGMYCAGMLAGAHSVWSRFPELKDRSLQQQGTLALLLSAAMPLLVCTGVATPALMSSLAAHYLPMLHLPPAMAHPEIVLMVLPNMIIVPMTAHIVGYLSGQSTRQMLPMLTCGSISSGCYAVAAVAGVQHPVVSGCAFGLGAVCSLHLFRSLTQSMPDSAVAVSSINRLRVKVVSDLMVFCQGGSIIFEALALQGVGFPEPICLSAILLFEGLGKIGAMHLSFRAHQVIKNADDHAELRRRLTSNRAL